MNENALPESHLLVAGISLADVEATMSFARLILERLQVVPAGLLVEMRISNFATGTGHRIVSKGGALQDIPSDEKLQQVSKSEARALRTLMSQLAAERSTRWSCEVAEGDLVACACAATAGDDVLLLCQRPMLGFNGKVLLLGAAKIHSATALNLAQALAKASETSVLEIEAGDVDAEEIFSRVDRSRTAAIVVDLNVGPLTSEEDLRRLVSAARCPVVVIGANRTRHPALVEDADGQGLGV
ncbi:hypothetical protein [Ruegeria arenilitoris]|uniref:hypothetical protein n=1 Tax=Ruegeria arenilitoris TaxID=1173585 RepID=UPI0014810BEA|nr:hypothetical protein [Ruegeria arenilitoris]